MLHSSLVVVLALSAGLAQGADKRVIQPKGAAPNAGWSHGLLVDGTLYVSGMGGGAATGSIPATFEAEVKQALDNINAVLKEGGMTLSNVVSVPGIPDGWRIVPSDDHGLQGDVRGSHAHSHHGRCRQARGSGPHRNHGHRKEVGGYPRSGHRVACLPRKASTPSLPSSVKKSSRHRVSGDGVRLVQRQFELTVEDLFARRDRA